MHLLSLQNLPRAVKGKRHKRKKNMIFVKRYSKAGLHIAKASKHRNNDQFIEEIMYLLNKP